MEIATERQEFLQSEKIQSRETHSHLEDMEVGWEPPTPAGIQIAVFCGKCGHIIKRFEAAEEDYNQHTRFLEQRQGLGLSRRAFIPNVAKTESHADICECGCSENSHLKEPDGRRGSCEHCRKCWMYRAKKGV